MNFANHNNPVVIYIRFHYVMFTLLILIVFCYFILINEI